jgi:hypothetical protein
VLAVVLDQVFAQMLDQMSTDELNLQAMTAMIDS